MNDKLHLTLTDADVEDLHKSIGSLNTMTQEGVEVIAYPDDFTDLVWAALDSGNPAVLNMAILGQFRVVEVVVTKETA